MEQFVSAIVFQAVLCGIANIKWYSSNTFKNISNWQEYDAMETV